MKVWFYDIECFPNYWCCTFKNRDTNKIQVFELSDFNLNIKELIDFLEKEVSGLIGYNCLNYDYPLLHFILTKKKVTNEELYQESQRIISTEFPDIRKPLLQQLDLYKIWHFDNKAKATSLKGVEVAIRFNNVEDMPFPFNHIVKLEDIQEILDYNLNDVNATEAFYNITIGKIEGLYKDDNKIQLRKDIQREFGINCLNYNDVKIGEEINKKYYLELSGRNWYDVKSSVTERKWINIKDLIPTFIKFKSDTLNAFLEEIKECSFMTHEKFKRKFDFADLHIVFAKGGLHSEDEPNIFEPKENEVMCDIDVGSMYPAIIINLELYPAHLGSEFLEAYKKVFQKRLEAKKTNKSVAAALKLALNGGGYGKMGSKTSWMKDELVMYKVTFAGQLSLLMLIEELYLNDIKILSANTDGLTVLFDKSKIDLFNSIKTSWETITKLQLEQSDYKKYIRRDCNNYLILKSDDTLKYKGCFDWQPEIHKNHSQLIVAIALEKFFINNIPVEDTIKDHKEIYDFCCAVKKIKNSKFETWIFDKQGNKQIQHLGKVVRYYISNIGIQLMKILPPLLKQTITKTEKHKSEVDKDQMNLFDFVDDVKIIKNRETNCQKGVLCTIFNKFEQKSMEDYQINYEYYINECNKIIKLINLKI